MTYDRRKDTSYLRREPVVLDREAGQDELEHMHRIDDKDGVRPSLKNIIRTIRNNNSAVTDVDTRRLDSINNLDNLHKLRQIVRNRNAQVHHKIIHTEGRHKSKSDLEGTSLDMQWELDGGIKTPQHGGHPIPGGKRVIQKANTPEESNVVFSKDRYRRQKEVRADAIANDEPVPEEKRRAQTNKTHKKSTWLGQMPSTAKIVKDK